MKRINKTIRATRWLRTECPDCTDGAILSTIIEPIAGSTATGDVFLPNIRCALHERTNVGLPAMPNRNVKERSARVNVPAAERELRNCGEDTRVYMPPSIVVFIALLLGAMAAGSALSASESQRKITGTGTGANPCRPLTTSVLRTQGTRHGYSPLYRQSADPSISRSPSQCAHFQCCAETGGATMKRIRPSDAEFKRLWNASKSANEFAKKIGLTRATASNQACNLRRSGMRLKSFSPVPNVVTCRHCRNEFQTPPSAVRKGRRFCSVKCAVAAGEWGRGKIHGDTGKRLHTIWMDMRRRCRLKSDPAYQYYGARGISACREWDKSYVVFRKWALAHGYRDGLEIDRRDTLGNYTPSNCRWVTRLQQMKNQRTRSNEKTSQFKGVSWHAQSRKWRAQIWADNVHYDLGMFMEEVAAARAYDHASKRLHRQFGRTNFT